MCQNKNLQERSHLFEFIKYHKMWWKKQIERSIILPPEHLLSRAATDKTNMKEHLSDKSWIVTWDKLDGWILYLFVSCRRNLRRSRFLNQFFNDTETLVQLTFRHFLLDFFGQLVFGCSSQDCSQDCFSFLHYQLVIKQLSATTRTIFFTASSPRTWTQQRTHKHWRE